MSSVINIQNLHHSYGTKQIYAGLNLKIEAGSVFGLLGKNGVGKSTLINILMGYLRPNSGHTICRLKHAVASLCSMKGSPHTTR